ncbi:C1 family peptidase [Desulfoplanes sp. PS50]
MLVPIPGFRPFFFCCLCSLYAILSLPASLFAEPASLLSAYDLRDVNGVSYIGPVKNQNPLGTCYAFAAVATAEGTYNKAQADYDGNPVSLSESFVVWSLGQKYEGFPTGRNGGGSQLRLRRTPGLGGLWRLLRRGVPLYNRLGRDQTV